MSTRTTTVTPTRRRGLRLAVAAAAVAALGLAAPAASAATPSSGATHPRLDAGTLVFDDEFDGPAGSGVDGSKWTQEEGGSGNGNNEREYYTPGTGNVALDGNGDLAITAKRENPAGYQCWYGSCEYTSGRINTSGHFTTTYGHVESRIKVPKGQGMWPAFWMLGSNIGSVGWPQCGEVDVMENVGFEPKTVHGTIHGPGYSGANGLGAPYSLPNQADFGDDFHTYAVDWSPSGITWSVDGVAYQTRSAADVGGNQWVFDHDFFVILNLAVGGQWPGDPDGSTPFPNQMLVDYVRVYTQG